MNREQAKQLLPVIKEFADGADIQFLDQSGKWYDVAPWTDPTFASKTEYRIKPKPLEAWAVIDTEGDMRGGGSFNTRKDAEEFVENSFDSRCKPFRIALLREVAE